MSMRLISLIFLVAMAGCSQFNTAMPRSRIVVAGSDMLVPLENSLFAFEETMPTILADRARIRNVIAQSSGESAAMQDLCGEVQSRPDIVLLTRSPQMVEIRRCEERGVTISADLVALYDGKMSGAPGAGQLWIAFVPAQVQRNPAARRAVRLLRYEFPRLIEGTVYAPYFTARRS